MLLAYRLPREPSTPRSAVWRRLRRLGVAWLGDGLVALPADARTTEQLEWVAEAVCQAGGRASLWAAHPLEAATAAELAGQMAAAVAADYAEVARQAREALREDLAGRRRVLSRLRRQLYRVGQRDYFPPPERDVARVAVAALAADVVEQAEVGAPR